MIGNTYFLRLGACALTILGCLITESTTAQPNALLPDTDTRETNRETNANGHLKEELKLAGDYMMGRGGVVRDLKQAAHWYRKAADQGFPPAQVQLGYCDRLEFRAMRNRRNGTSDRLRIIRRKLACSAVLRGTGIPRNVHLGCSCCRSCRQAVSARGRLPWHSLPVSVSKKIRPRRKSGSNARRTPLRKAIKGRLGRAGHPPRLLTCRLFAGLGSEPDMCRACIPSGCCW